MVGDRRGLRLGVSFGVLMIAAIHSAAFAQTVEGQTMPPVHVEAPPAKRAAPAKPRQARPLPVRTNRQVLAQSDRNDVTVLDPITVPGERLDGPVNGYVATQSSTASKTGASILDTPQSVSVIGREELTDRAVQTTTQAIQYTPGVFASTSPVSQRFDYYSIRGFDATLSGILLDGLRSTTAQSYVRYQPYGMERVEVLRGPNGFLYGAGSPGGVVNLISKRPTDEVLREVGVQYGSYNRLQGQFDFSGPVNDDKTLLYRLVGVGRKSDTQFDYVPDNTGYLAPSFTWRPDADTSLTVLGSISRDEFGPPRPFLPIYGTLLPNPNGKIPWNTYLDGKGLDNHMTQANIGYIFDHRFSDVWSVHSSSRYTHTDLFTQTLSGMSLAPDMRTLNRAAYQFGITGDIFATDNNTKAEWDAGPVRGISVFGVSWRNTGEDYYLNFGRAASIDIYNPSYGAAFSATTPFTKTNQSADEIGLYTAHMLTVADRLVLDLAARQDWVSVDTDNKLNGTSTSQKDHDFTYRVGLTYLTDFGVAPYASYATSFSPVLGTNFYGEAFKPTTGKQIEAGIKYQPNGFDGLFTVAWFHLVQENVRTTDPNNPLNSIQTGEITSQGLELSAVANITPAFKVLASYTYNDLETTKTSDAAALGKVPTGLPEHTVSFWGDYTIEGGPFAGLGFGAGVRHVGPTYADTANTIEVPDFTLVDAAIRYDFGKLRPDLKGVKLAVNVTNLFDKQYYSSCSATSCNQGYGRSVLATLSYGL
ncbi:MAG: TonB-dependent siderophore receptor [Pseudolabrys sp.]